MAAGSQDTTHPLETPSLAKPPGPKAAAPFPVIPGYEILERFKGGQADVYRVTNKGLGRPEALKLLPGERYSQPEMVTRFLQEARAMAHLGKSNPNIVPVYNFSDSSAPPHFFTMKFAEGGDLSKNLLRFRADLRKAALLMEKVARAIHHAHANGILHRDLKPANILLDEFDEPLVSDFGLAKVFAADQQMTQTHVLLGTAPYMAPEQTTGDPTQITAASDIWALGVILYELFTGRKPFGTLANPKLFEHIRTADPTEPRALNQNLPKGLQTICLKCLEKDPARRYATAGKLADDLAHWREGRPIEAKPEPWLRYLGRVTRRHWLVSSAAGAAALAAVGVPVALHYLDPDRKLKAIQERLRRGETVTLLSDTGRPEWSRWLVSQGGFAESSADQSPLTIHAANLSLLELVQDPQVECYQLSADVYRHNTLGGDVGVYCGCSLHRLGEQQVCRFIAFRLIGGYQPDASLRLFACRHPDAGEGFVLKEKTEPSWSFDSEKVGKRHPWYRLAVHVTPQGLVLQWDDWIVGTLSWAELGRRAAELLTRRNPFPEFVPPLAPRSALGLFVRNDMGSFRNVVLEPRQNQSD